MIKRKLILVYNLLFYLCPYVPMILYGLRHRTPDKLKRYMTGVGAILLISVSIYSVVLLMYYGYARDGGFVLIFSGFIPTYLLTFYAVGTLITVLACYITSYSLYDSLSVGFIISYVASFYWEIPENIFWQIKRGYHPAIILTLLGAFPYIWLNKTIGWEKNRNNIGLVLFGWFTTLVGVLTLKSNVYSSPTEGLYFLGCRIVCLLVLIKIFVLKDVANFCLTKMLIYLKWIIRYTLKGNWRLGTEIGYWDYRINYDRLDECGEWKLSTKHNDVYFVLDRAQDVFGIGDRDMKVLEVGPGPRSRMTDIYDKGIIDLVAVDPLADNFKKHLGGREFLYQGYCETMSKHFPCESFHMSYASNVLDHTQHIEQCFSNLVRLTKIGGLILIQGNIREGERLNWMGLHKYSMWLENGNILYKTKDGPIRNLTRNRGLELEIKNMSRKDGWYSITYRRVK